MTLLEKALASPRATKHLHVKDQSVICERAETAVAFFDQKIDGLQFAAAANVSRGAAKAVALSWLGQALSAGIVKVEVVK